MGSTANEFEVDYYENILEVIIVGMISIEELKQIIIMKTKPRSHVKVEVIKDGKNEVSKGDDVF